MGGADPSINLRPHFFCACRARSLKYQWILTRRLDRIRALPLSIGTGARQSMVETEKMHNHNGLMEFLG
ncbi:MAG: hypothetical protein ACM3QT_00085 [Syntrophothermus sp.]